jgi:hypothetical protein
VNELLGAASLFLAVLGLLYGAWYGEIMAADSIRVPRYSEDRRPAITQVRAAYRTRSLPLAIGSAAIAIILAPSFVETVLRAVRACSDSGVGAIRSYDAVGTLFCAVYVATVLLTIHTARMTVRLRRRLAELRAPQT